MKYLQEANPQRQKSRLEVIRGWGRGDEKLLLNAYKVSVWDDEKFWKWKMMVVE